MFVLVSRMPAEEISFITSKYKFYIKSGSYSKMDICPLYFPLLWVSFLIVPTLIKPAKRAKNSCPFSIKCVVY